jgi:hypothetical protein
MRSVYTILFGKPERKRPRGRLGIIDRVLLKCMSNMYIARGYIQKFPDWPPGARTANNIALYH